MARSYIKDDLAHALLELTKIKSLQKITVAEIIAHCGISKQSFYNHFTDKNDLITYICATESQKAISEAIREEKGAKEVILHYYRRVRSMKHFYRSFIRDPDLLAMLFQIVLENTQEYTNGQIEGYCGKERITSELTYAIRFQSAGNAQLFVDWVIEDMQTSPEVMAEINFACIPNPVRECLNVTKIHIDR